MSFASHRPRLGFSADYGSLIRLSQGPAPRRFFDLFASRGRRSMLSLGHNAFCLGLVFVTVLPCGAVGGILRAVFHIVHPTLDSTLKIMHRAPDSSAVRKLSASFGNHLLAWNWRLGLGLGLSGSTAAAGCKHHCAESRCQAAYQNFIFQHNPYSVSSLAP